MKPKVKSEAVTRRRFGKNATVHPPSLADLFWHSFGRSAMIFGNLPRGRSNLCFGLNGRAPKAQSLY